MNVGLDIKLFLNNIEKLDIILNSNTNWLKKFQKKLSDYLQQNVNKNEAFINYQECINKIYIFLPHYDYKYIKIIVEEILKEKGIEFSEVICCEDKYKNDLIRNRNIHYMISNEPSFFQNIERDIFCLLIGEHNKYIEQNNILSFENSQEVLSFISNKYLSLKKHIKDPITVLSGIPSIDKIWTRDYSIDQTTVKTKRNMNLYNYIYSNVCNNLDAPAILYFNKKISFRQLFSMVDKCAAELEKKYGVKEKEVVTICMPNTPEAAVSFLAIMKIGAVALLLHPLLKDYEIKNALCKTRSKYIITSDVSECEIYKIILDTNVQHMFVASVSKSMPTLIKTAYNVHNIKNTLQNKRAFLLQKDKKYIKKKWSTQIDTSDQSFTSVYNPNSIALLLMTGGTTGTPKLTALTNENCIANIEQLKYTIPSYKPFDVIEGVTPLFHGFGLVDTILTAWAVNLAVDMHPKYNPKLFAKSIEKNKPVLILGVPTLFKSIIHNKSFDGKEMPYLKVWITGGSTLDATLHKEIDEWRKEHHAENPIFSGIGLTESTAAIAFTGLNSKYDSSVGFPLPFNNVKIVSLEDGHELGYGEPGELCISGPTIMKEYFDNEQETNLVLKKENGKQWLHTGDICSLFPNGEICFIDRNKGVIIVSGINVYRNEVEEIINTLDIIKDCAVIGIPHPYAMNVPKAFVVLKDGRQLDEDLKQELIRYCNEKMDKYHRIFDMEQMDALPLTNINKVNYLKLEEQEKAKQKVK